MSPIKILFIEANPSDSPYIRTTPELRDLEAALKAARFGDAFAVIPMLAARGGDLLHALSEHQPHILHFAAHGDGDGLLLHRPGDEESELLRTAELAAMVATHQDAATQRLHLVVLAGCYTASMAEALAATVDAAVGMAGEIDDPLVQQVITPMLYRRLADGASLANALAAVDVELRRQDRDDAAEMVWLQPESGGQVSALAWRRRELSPAMLDYLRSWFDKPWASVPLAEILGLTDDDGQRIDLLDVYVPLPVDFSLTVKTQHARIVDWWAKTAQEEALARKELPEDTEAGLAELRPRLRTWPALGVDETGLQPVVDLIERKIENDYHANKDDKSVQDGEHNWYMEAHDAASVQPRFVLLGEPDSGKSSFLRHLALCLAGELRRRSGDARTPANAGLPALRDWLLDAFAPVYVEMRELVTAVFPALPAAEGAPVTLPDIEHFWRYLQQHYGDGLSGPGGELRAWFERGEAILLLDGLDEAPQADRQERRRQIKALIAALLRRYPDLCVIVAGRPHAYRAGEWIIDGFGVAELRPLEMGRLHELASALFPAALGEAGKAQADAFIAAVREQLKNRRIEESFYANPLFFTLLAGLWLDPDAREQLPATRAELYRRAVDLLLTRWTRRRLPDASVADTLGLDAAGLRSVLETLACTVHEQSAPEQDTTRFGVGELLTVLFRAQCKVLVHDVPDYLARHVGLLTSPMAEEFYFTHRSFQEHLAACELICAAPDEHLPPVAAERRFPDGLVRRTLAQPALWANVARLAVDELMAHDRQRDGGSVLAALCRPYVTQQAGPEAALLALEIAAEHKIFHGDSDELEIRRQDFAALQAAAVAAVADPGNFAPPQRLLAGNLLGARPGLDPRPGVNVRKDNGLPDLAWIKIPACDAQGQHTFFYHDGERDVRRDSPPDFWIARYPVTYAQFQAFVDDPEGYRNPRWREGLADYFGETQTRWEQRWPIANRPRENVTWPEAVVFCRWLTAQARTHPTLLPDADMLPRLEQGWSIRLPTEVEWVKAARGWDDRRYPWGPAYQSGRANVDETENKNGPYNLGETAPAGMYPHGASPFGVEEMSGGVWEYCLNKYDNPNDADLSGDDQRATRGGSWYWSAQDSSVAARGGDVVSSGGSGFRVVCAASPSL
ncbi:MAG: SUMF1/EgtB/PvdO family nonheme iron enzyme [Anaerolineales bacterium]|nr:SUMF1/EgtB/PvdO family nonheme iron enzyme [Anaerolineales bacterium]